MALLLEAERVTYHGPGVGADSGHKLTIDSNCMLLHLDPPPLGSRAIQFSLASERIR